MTLITAFYKPRRKHPNLPPVNMMSAPHWLPWLDNPDETSKIEADDEFLFTEDDPELQYYEVLT